MRKYIPIIILLVLSAFNVRMAEGLARKALVAPDCMINNLINVAKVASGVTNMDYLLDENLNNYATFSGVAGVDVAVGPVVRIKDLKNVYRSRSFPVSLRAKHRSLQASWLLSFL